jgi:hypothetical protein
VSKNETDILLIRKYLNGELDAHAMHELEKRALDDPFLMDAMEGYEKAENQHDALVDLSSRLQERVMKKEGHIIPYRTLAIAASVLVVLGIGWVWLSRDQPPAPPVIAHAAKPAVNNGPAPVAADPAEKKTQTQLAIAPPAHARNPRKIKAATGSPEAMAPNDDALADNMIASADVSAVSPDTAADDPTPLNEMVVMGYAAKQKKDAADKTTVVSAGEAKASAVPVVQRPLQSRVAGVTKTAAGSPFSAPSQKTLVQGRIVDKLDGTPLPGVSVKVPGTRFGALTDNNGKFSLPVDSSKHELVIAYLGYNTMNVNAQDRDSLKTIGLVPNSNSLSEVVVTNYNRENKEDAKVTAAHPQAGWPSFKKYLSESAVSPDAKAGVVKLSFMVDRSGAISEVAVVKGLSPASNKKAIDLITNGPKWSGNSSGQTEQVNVRVKFGK